MNGPQTGERLDLAGVQILGRAEDCDLLVEEGSVSRRHARFKVSGGSVTIEDLQSTNGTRVNGLGISQPRALALGDVIELGGQQVRLVSPDSGDA